MNVNYDLLFMKELEKIKDVKPSLLLHVCCGPCSGNVLKEICKKFKITILYSNSNIYPSDEYYRRLNELKDFIKQFNQDYQENIEIIEKEYRPSEYMNDLSLYGNIKEGGKRCYFCYKKRMHDAYDLASKHSFDYWTTVLSVSPHKNSQWINEIGDSYPRDKTKFLNSDFKKNNGYQKSVTFASSYHLYRQNYCGCIYSYYYMIEREKQKQAQQQ